MCFTCVTGYLPRSKAKPPGGYRWSVAERQTAGRQTAGRQTAGRQTAGRRWAGTWLAGTRPAGEAEGYPGQRLGLPEHGPQSVAGLGRRLVALFVDWLLSLAVALAVFHSGQWPTLAVFALQAWLLTGLTGLTIGKRLLGMRVARLDGRPVGLGWALVRTILLVTVLPALFTDRDQRGLHDRAANTVVVRI